MYCYLAGSVVFPIIYKQGDFEVATHIDAKWEASSENVSSILSYIVMVAIEPISFEGGLGSTTAQSNIEPELAAAAAIVMT